MPRDSGHGWPHRDNRSPQMAAEAIKLKTLEDLLSYSEDERVELIAGNIVERTMPRPKHGQAQLQLGVNINPFNRKKQGSSDPGGWLIVTEVGVYYDQHNSCVHDLAGWRRERISELPDESFVKILPDWICEIVSPGGRKRDTVDKFRLLQKYEIPFYWVVDPDEETITVYRFQSGGEYVVSAIAQSSEIVALQPFNIEIEIGVIFGH